MIENPAKTQKFTLEKMENADRNHHNVPQMQDRAKTNGSIL